LDDTWGLWIEIKFNLFKIFLEFAASSLRSQWVHAAIQTNIQHYIQSLNLNWAFNTSKTVVNTSKTVVNTSKMVINIG